MQIGSIKFHRRAVMALGELPAEDQNQVRARVTALADLEPGRWEAEHGRPLGGDTSLYLLPVNASLRLIVRAPNGQPPEVLDIVRHETIQTFAQT